MDINLTDGDRFGFCRWLKARSQIQVLFLSARDLEEDMLKGYELGAVDYVTKPFSIKILQKKAAVILSREPKRYNIYDDGFLRIDFELGKVQKGKEECLVTPTEYRILKKLIQNRGKMLTYSLLLDSLWEEGVQLMDKHALAVNINRLRKKSRRKNIPIFLMYMGWAVYGNNIVHSDLFTAGIGGVFAVENAYVKTGYLRVCKEPGYDFE